MRSWAGWRSQGLLIVAAITLFGSALRAVQAPAAPQAPAPAAPNLEFFETKIRPLLAANCFACHGESARGGLRVDSREGLLRGGSSGPVIIPGDPDKSTLLK